MIALHCAFHAIKRDEKATLPRFVALPANRRCLIINDRVNGNARATLSTESSLFAGNLL